MFMIDCYGVSSWLVEQTTVTWGIYKSFGITSLFLSLSLVSLWFYNVYTDLFCSLANVWRSHDSNLVITIVYCKTEQTCDVTYFRYLCLFGQQNTYSCRYHNKLATSLFQYSLLMKKLGEEKKCFNIGIS